MLGELLFTFQLYLPAVSADKGGGLAEAGLFATSLQNRVISREFLWSNLWVSGKMSAKDYIAVVRFYIYGQ
ncbi:MAG: hypothetical protein ACYS1A_07055 [Planctomycetota bacterium]|jgi:hypothetical protein